MLELILLLSDSALELIAPGDQFTKLCAGGAGRSVTLGRKAGAKLGQDLRVYSIGFGQSPAGSCKVTDLARVNQEKGYLGAL